MRWLGDFTTAKMIGATIGMGGYAGKAAIAARQFAWATGLPVAIIDDAELPRVAELTATHVPGALPAKELPFTARFFLFDLLPHERLIYFDADLLTVNRWDPEPLDPAELHVVRDFAWSPRIAQETADWDLPGGRYFNSGLMVLARDFHAAMFRAAARAWFLRPTTFHDQTRINYGAWQCGARINWLDRDYNVLCGARTCEAGRFAVKGLHLGGGVEEAEYEEIIRRSQGRGIMCLSPAEIAAAGLRVAGTWRYERGRESRPLQLWPDGHIGLGSRNCERFWRVWMEEGRPTLGVFGYCTPNGTVSETFRAVYDGQAWRGRWNAHERNECVLVPMEEGGEQGAGSGEKGETTGWEAHPTGATFAEPGHPRSGSATITAVVLNWKRPENVARIVDGWSRQGLIGKRIVWSNNYSGLPPIAPGRGAVLVTASGEDDLNTRFIAASMAEQECVLIQDDDLELPGETIEQLYRAWQAERDVIHGIYGRWPGADGSYNCRDAPPGECRIVLTKALVASRENVCRMLVHLPEFAEVQRCGRPRGNGEDIIFSYVARRYSGRMNRVHNLPVTALAADDAISRWPGHTQHRTRVLQFCEAWLRQVRKSLSDEV